MSTMSILHTDDNGMLLFEASLLEHIRLKENIEILYILEDFNPSDLSDAAGKTLLHFAAEYGNDEFARILIDYLGAKVDARDQLKETPLMLAIKANEVATVQVLLAANADIFVADLKGQCCLGLALKASVTIAADILAGVLDKVTSESLKASEYVASDVFHRDCPLYHFILLDNAELTRVLLQKGCPIDVQMTNSGISALHEAVRSNCVDNVKLLLEYGANANVEDHLRETPLDYVRYSSLRPHENSMLEIIRALIDAGANWFEPVSRRLIVAQTLELGTREMVRAVLQCPIELHLRDKNNMTPLHYLARNKQLDILEELSHFHFDINVRDQDRFTMLHHAAFTGNPSSVKFLLDSGADLYAKDFRGRTPLFFIAEPSLMWKHNNRYYDYANCAEILLDYGADPHAFILENSLVIRLSYREMSDELFRPILAKLVLLEACGQPINIFVRKWIESFSRFERILNSVKRQLEEMKKTKIDGLMTLFDFITTNNLSRFARNARSISEVTRVIVNYKTSSSYYYILRQRLFKFNRVVERRNELVDVINEVLTKLSNLMVFSVANRIVDYLKIDVQ